MGHVPQRAEAGEGMHSVGLKDWIRRWPTPTVDDSSNVTRESGSFQSLTRAVREAWEPEPTEDAAGTTAGNMQRMLTHQAKESDPEGTAAGGQLNPTWVEWLMGFPAGWTDCEHLATPSFRKSLKRSGGGS